MYCRGYHAQLESKEGERMKLDKMDLFTVGTMLFLFYVFKDMVHTGLDALFYYSIPMSLLLVDMYLKVEERKKEIKDGN